MRNSCKLYFEMLCKLWHLLLTFSLLSEHFSSDDNIVFGSNRSIIIRKINYVHFKVNWLFPLNTRVILKKMWIFLMYNYSYHKFSVVNKNGFYYLKCTKNAPFWCKVPQFPRGRPAPPAACGVILPLFGASCLSELVTSAPNPPPPPGNRGSSFARSHVY